MKGEGRDAPFFVSNTENPFAISIEQISNLLVVAE
jgi:hypothetical protein